MVNNPKPHAPQRLYQRVVEQIEESLNDGSYPIGSRLPTERELAEHFEVSRPTIREAMIALEVKGRVVVKMGSGVYVIEPQDTRISNSNFSPFELTEARVLLEGEAAALAATMIDSESISALEDAYHEMIAENERGDLTSEVADRKFHRIIANATNNRILIETIDHLFEIQERSPDIQDAHNSVCQQDGEIRLKEHRDIIDALKEQNPNAARKAMRAHFARGLKAMHDVSEAKEVERIKEEMLALRKRFSVNKLYE